MQISQLAAQRSTHDAALPRLALLVEPDADTRALYKAFLVPRRYAVEEADDGRDALAKAISDPPDIIVMETVLPLIDGFSLCALLRQDRLTKAIPIVVLTGDVSSADHARALSAGADVVLVKPCLPDALLMAIQDVRARSGAVRMPAARLCTTVDQRLVASAQALARGGEVKATLSKKLARYQPTTPPNTPCELVCPACNEHLLEYVCSFVGGVSALSGTVG
jgi:two-component system cell cycle response regulator DivK